MIAPTGAGARSLREESIPKIPYFPIGNPEQTLDGLNENTLIDFVRKSNSPERLKYPLVLIPGGGNSKPDFEPLIESLTSGGENQAVCIEHPRELRAFEKNYRGQNIVIFRFPNRIDSLMNNARYIQRGLQSFSNLTGSREFFVSTNCKGGLDFRYFLSLPGAREFTFPKVCYVAPPNHGFVQVGEGIAAARFMKKIFRLPIRTVGGYYCNRDTTEGLDALRTDFSIFNYPNNPQLRQINTATNFKIESETVGKTIVIAGTGLSLFTGRTRWPILKHGFFLLPKTSDSVVPLWSADLPHAHLCVIQCKPVDQFMRRSDGENSDYFLDPHKLLVTNEASVAKQKEEFTGIPMQPQLKTQILEREPKSNLEEKSASFMRMAAHASSGALIGLCIGAGAVLYSPWLFFAGKSSPIFFGAFKYGKHKPESKRLHQEVG